MAPHNSYRPHVGRQHQISGRQYFQTGHGASRLHSMQRHTLEARMPARDFLFVLNTTMRCRTAPLAVLVRLNDCLSCQNPQLHTSLPTRIDLQTRIWCRQVWEGAKSYLYKSQGLSQNHPPIPPPTPNNAVPLPRQFLPRDVRNLCGSCHGSISNRDAVRSLSGHVGWG